MWQELDSYRHLIEETISSDFKAWSGWKFVCGQSKNMLCLAGRLATWEPVGKSLCCCI